VVSPVPAIETVLLVLVVFLLRYTVAVAAVLLRVLTDSLESHFSANLNHGE
jgi:hypothetical protein|tara:strand:+ start:1912 stop:2064 length:153 start_codon:yes stop_codon:yes gene_type:complete